MIFAPAARAMMRSGRAPHATRTVTCTRFAPPL
jgi:hypothetical protein